MAVICAGLALIAPAAPSGADGLFPLIKGGPFTLVDHNGQTRTQIDPEGHAQLLFFGYANCPGICTAALPLMADVTDAVATHGITVTPLMITVDPARDTVQTMGAPLARVHPDLVGLTGDAEALSASYAAFNVDHRLAYEDPEYGPVYSHGSLVYLLDGGGAVLTVLPPVLSAAQATDIVLSYLRPQG
ncbi:SCO family protein [Sulfitobacter sp. HNIBRBA3233]|uniref:SCO family protein n=1 Tax=Sulfitobacter marinivivus TaxID=3158558 RepID=UPI0032DF5458